MGASPASAAVTLAAMEINRQLRIDRHVMRCANCNNIVRRDVLEHYEPSVKCKDVVPYRATR